MRSVIRTIRACVEARRRHYREDGREIAANNMRTLRSVTLLTVCLLAVFLLFTPLVLPGWRPSIWHLLFLPASLGMFLAVLLIGRRKRPVRRNSSTLLCVVYEVILFFFIVMIDVPGTPDAPASFLSMMCVIMPALFTLPFALTYGLIGLAVLAFILLTLAYKPGVTGRYDVFEAIVAVFFSLAVEHLITRLRIRDYETRLEYKRLSTRDALSDIYNKLAGESAVRRYFQACNPKVMCAFMVIDLDDFKSINDTQGHRIGDAVLHRIGESLQSIFRATDIIGRFGGDEFVVLTKGMSSERALMHKFEQIRAGIESQDVPGGNVRATCSLGAVLITGQEADYESVFEQADAALYAAKALGKNTCVIVHYAPGERRGAA